MSSNKLLPAIRFPEFKNKEDWKVKTIDELCDVLNNIRKPISSSDRKKGTYPYYGASGIIDYVDNFLFDERLLLIGEDGAKWGAYENTAFLVDGKYWVNNHAHVLKPNLINDKLLESYLVKLDLHPYITGAAPPKLTLGKLKEIPIPFSENKIEQQKIASCLSSLDEVITAHIQKLDLLKDQKKGLMQNLFPQEGETVPKFRFKEFEKDGEWVEEILGDVIKYFKGFAFQSIDYTSKGRRIIRVSDMGFDYIKNDENAIYINEGDAIQYEKWQLKKDDLIITTVGSKPPMYDSLVGRTIIVESKDESALLNQNAVCLRANSKIAQKFLNTLFKKSEYVNFIVSIIRGNANQGSIALEDLFKYKFLQPKNPKEQKKIASCLSSLDSIITAQADKIEQLKLHKKGLMQGLFPKIQD